MLLADSSWKRGTRTITTCWLKKTYIRKLKPATTYLLLPLNDVSEELQSALIIGRQVHVHFSCHYLVQMSFALHMVGKLGNVHLYHPV